MNLKILVVLASYNERESLPQVIEAVEKHLPAASILVIDDSSPDGTGEWATRHAESRPHLNVIVRTGERGLGSATIAGFRWGLEREFDLIATMDADSSHPVERLPAMVDELKQNSVLGVVIGSRYVAGGKVVGWPLRRRVISRLTNWLARTWLGLKTRDNTGAYRVYRTKELAKVELSTIRAHGYGYLEELIYRLQRNGTMMKEVPITFRDREVGQSKTSLSEGLKVLLQIITLRFRRFS